MLKVRLYGTFIGGLQHTVIPSNRLQDNRADKIIPLFKERLDMAAYTFTYHMENGCALEKDCFGGE
jgi:hypothetical protein